jgi:chromosome segregation ATPase
LFFKKKIEELNTVHENEKNNIIVSYEHTVEKLNKGYVESKEKYANIIKQREDYIKELITEHQKEINDLNDIITKLKECNNTSKTDQEQLIKMNDVLKQTLTTTNNELNDIKKELKRNEKEKKKMGSTITKLSTKNEELRVGNEKLHGIVYGKFKHK